MNEFATLSTWQNNSIARSNSGEVFCFVGYRQESQPADIAYYAVSVATRDSVGPSECRFVRLIGGTLSLQSLLAPDEPVQLVENHFLSLPKGSDSFFGVTNRSTRTDNAELTQQIFDATYTELKHVADCFGILTGRTVNAGRKLLVNGA